MAGLTQSLAGTTARADAAESALALAREQVAEHARARGAAEAARDAAVSKRCGAEADAGTAWREVDRLKAVAAAAIEAKEVRSVPIIVITSRFIFKCSCFNIISVS